MSVAAASKGPVLIIGAGLLGTSLGLALRTLKVEVRISDIAPTSLALARDLGAGTIDELNTPEPKLVVVATPPDVAAECVINALSKYPVAVVTDVASVKSTVLELVLSSGADITRYVGSHPMAGREKSGAAAADADLFAGRPWVIVAHENSNPQALLVLRELASDVGAFPIALPALAHDQSVALISHLPQLISSILAARLVTANSQALSLAGQGLRDTTRIASSDPRLWAAIITANAEPIVEQLTAFRQDLDKLIEALTRESTLGPLTPGAVGAITDVMARGNLGTERIPGKHGGAPHRYGEVTVLVPDSAGELGRLFTEVGEENINIEDLVIEHSAGRAVGLAIISVEPRCAVPLEKALTRRGWRVVSSS